MVASARLEARGIVVERERKRILDGAALAIAAGEIVALQGASGSGKTTLLRVMASLCEATAGTVLLDGTPAREIGPRTYRRKVAYVPQQPPMLEGTVADNVRAGPRLRGAELADADVARLLDRVGLGADLASRPAKEISGGERQRVALARALANEPDAMLLDEPTSALDPASAARVLDLVRGLAKAGLAVAVVTHVEEHAAALGGTRYECAGGLVVKKREGA